MRNATRVCSFVFVVILASLLASNVALAATVSPGNSVTTPAGNKVTNTGTADIEVNSSTVGGIEYVEVEGDGAHVELNTSDSAAEVLGDDTTVDHNAADTEADVEGHPTAINNASAVTIGQTSGTPTSHSTR